MSFSHKYLAAHSKYRFGLEIKGADFFEQCIQGIERRGFWHVGTAVIDATRHQHKYDKCHPGTNVPTILFSRVVTMIFTPYTHAALLVLVQEQEIKSDRQHALKGEHVAMASSSQEGNWRIGLRLGLKKGVSSRARGNEMLYLDGNGLEFSGFTDNDARIYMPIQNFNGYSNPANEDGSYHDGEYKFYLDRSCDTAQDLIAAVHKLADLTEPHTREGKLGYSEVLGIPPRFNNFPSCTLDFWAQIGVDSMKGLFNYVREYEFEP